MKKVIFTIFFITLLATVKASAEVVVYLASGYGTGQEVQLTLGNLADPNFPKPRHDLPVLFVHGQQFGDSKSYLGDWQQSFNGLPSFRETLGVAENSWLGIEPYYIDLEDFQDDEEKKNRSIEDEALKIKEAVQLILLHQGDPGAARIKVAVIAFGKGAISARCYLKKLWEDQNRRLSFHPVSELIAISPPNHGLSAEEGFEESADRDSLVMKQLCNGYDENCNRYPEPGSHDFIEKLIGTEPDIFLIQKIARE